MTLLLAIDGMSIQYVTYLSFYTKHVSSTPLRLPLSFHTNQRTQQTPGVSHYAYLPHDFKQSDSGFRSRPSHTEHTFVALTWCFFCVISPYGIVVRSAGLQLYTM
mmetsp:Transcript_31477/g.71106  ORF Transcript_31477/g.71106 Transcript_31477/m.71106 type:complete len:105 (-) Transcript_31477:61-375(-)